MASTVESKDSPLRSLSSFKSEIPGGDALGSMDAENSAKSFHQYLNSVINGAVFLSVIVILVLFICIIVSVELLISLNGCSLEDAKREEVKTALSATTLAFLALFLVEVTVRVLSLGLLKIKQHKLELFDVVVVTVTFVIDLALLASGVEDNKSWCKATTYIISLRLWRVYGIYATGVNKAREGAIAELQTVKYARNQAEIQADALQSQCDQQLKEIAHLRDFLRQHNLEPDSPKMMFPPDYRHRYTIAVDFDKADTVRVNDRVNSESSLASAIANLELISETDQRERVPTIGGGGTGGQGAHQGHSPSSLASTSAGRSPAHQNILGTTQVSGHPPRGSFDIEIGEEARETGARGDGMKGITNPAFDPEEDEEEEEDGDHTMEGPSDVPEGVSPSTNNNADDEAQLKLELEEIQRLSQEALEQLELTSTHEINGVPTTSL
ncbi:uncharacterized protein [Diadema setosum]|uniref:uncharacterized protein n=1 Tax=Diadema setosum TaxID=31175 RepID=UPI003B3B75EB